jgi:hypothetical protein
LRVWAVAGWSGAQSGRPRAAKEQPHSMSHAESRITDFLRAKTSPSGRGWHQVALPYNLTPSRRRTGMATTHTEAPQPIDTERRLFAAWRAVVGCAAILVACAAVADGSDALASTPMVLAQAGSTGGTIGKQGKSASGGDAEPRQRPNSRTGEKSSSGSCQKIVGSWSWVAGFETVFSANGTGRNSSPFAGPCTWTCRGGIVIVNWSSLGVIDRITIAQDGDHLLITNSRGDTFAATRK